MHAQRGSELQRPDRPMRTLRLGWSWQRLRWMIILAWLPAPWLLMQGLKQPVAEQRSVASPAGPPPFGRQVAGRQLAGRRSPDEPGQRLLLDLNEVPHEHLMLLPGVGPALAERIVRYRHEQGRFTTLQELRRVDGIGPVLTEQLSGYLFVDSPPLSRQEHAQSQ
jgi:competence ComEA-like helix-hairpin-helix protein